MTTRAPPDLRGGGKAVEPRHVQVEKDEPRLQPVRHLHALGAVRRDDRLDSRVFCSIARRIRAFVRLSSTIRMTPSEGGSPILARDRLLARFQLKPHRTPPLGCSTSSNETERTNVEPDPSSLETLISPPIA